MAAGIAGVQLVPVGDLFFAELPAEVDVAALVAAGEVDQAGFIVLEFDAHDAEFVDVVLEAFEGGVELLLEAEGFTLDSSQAKYKLAYYRPAARTSLTRIPASMTSSVLRFPGPIRDPLLSRLAAPVVLFVHPWEFVDLTRERLRLDCRFRTGAPALRALCQVVALFHARGARFVRMRDLDEAAIAA